MMAARKRAVGARVAAARPRVVAIVGTRAARAVAARVAAVRAEAARAAVRAAARVVAARVWRR